MADDINLYDLQEFVDFGYLQEANRQMFHLLGLSLLVKTNKKGEAVSLLVADFRNEPEGFFYGDKMDRAKGERVFAEFAKKAKFRKRILDGHNIQPLEKPISAIQIQRFRAKTGLSGRKKNG